MAAVKKFYNTEDALPPCMSAVFFRSETKWFASFHSAEKHSRFC